MLNVLSVAWQIAALRPSLVLYHLEASLTELSAKLILLLHEVVLGQVIDAKRVPRVGLESSLEELHCLLSHFIVIDVRCNLDYAQSRQCH